MALATCDEQLFLLCNYHFKPWARRSGLSLPVPSCTAPAERSYETVSTGCLPTPRRWKEICPRGVPLPAPWLEGLTRALAMGLVSILLALFLPHDSWVPVGMGWGLTGGWGRVQSPGLLLGIFYWWCLETGIIIPWETEIIQMLLLMEAAAQGLSEE